MQFCIFSFKRINLGDGNKRKGVLLNLEKRQCVGYRYLYMGVCFTYENLAGISKETVLR